VRSSGLKAGAAMKNNHHIFPEISGLLFLPFAQALAGRHHQHDRDDAPGNSKHSKEGAEFVSPQGSQNVFE
jgi:hypothetical protein